MFLCGCEAVEFFFVVVRERLVFLMDENESAWVSGESELRVEK